MSDDLDEGSSWIMVDPRVTSRGASSLPECLSLSIRLWPDVGATQVHSLWIGVSESKYNIERGQDC